MFNLQFFGPWSFFAKSTYVSLKSVPATAHSFKTPYQTSCLCTHYKQSPCANFCCSFNICPQVKQLIWYKVIKNKGHATDSTKSALTLNYSTKCEVLLNHVEGGEKQKATTTSRTFWPSRSATQKTATWAIVLCTVCKKIFMHSMNLSAVKKLCS